MESLKSFFDPSSYAQMSEKGTKRAALKKAMSRMFSSPQKDDADDESSGAAAARRHSSAYNIPVLVDSGSGMSVYEIEAGENGVSEVGDNTPLKYRLSVPSGFKQLSDPKARHATGTFVYGESNPTFLARRCELASVDKAIAVLRLKTGPIDKEMSNLESRRAKLITQIEAIPKLQDRFEFYIGISQPTSVELLPLKDEELQELSRLGEAEAQEKLSQGKGYDVLVTKQHHRASTGDKAKSASQARGGRGEEEDQAEWQGWEMVCCNPGEVEEGGAGGREGRRYAGVVLLRRKYIPDEGLYYQDITLSVSWIQGTGSSQSEEKSADLLPLLRQIADSITPIASRRNPLSFDTIEVLRHLEMLKMDEGYMAFFQRTLPPGKNRPGELSQDADEIATLLSSVVVSEVRGRGGGGGDDFEDSFDSPVQEVAEAWAKLQAIALQDSNNPLLMDQIVGGFYGGSEEDEPESEEVQLERTNRLRTAWAERVGRYVAFCIDGVTMGPGLRIRDLVEVACDRGGSLGEDQRVMRRVLEFCVHYKAAGAGFIAGSEPTCCNLLDGIMSEAAQRAIAHPDSRMNDIVLAKLLKLKYLRRLCASGAKSSLQPYAALLVALLQRPSNAVNLTLQVAKELADLACASETLGLLRDPAKIQAIAEHLQRPTLHEMVLYYAAIALNRLAQSSPAVQQQLQRSTLPLVLRAHMVRVSLRVRAATQQLLEQTRA